MAASIVIANAQRVFSSHIRVRPTTLELAELSQPEGQGSEKINKNNIRNQRVSTTFGLPLLVYRMSLSGNSGRRLRW